ncbi:hypothetical protein AB833_29650 [Chromatiales bacterium (ex Bugula neritina AB1)]|nr:hypothetical protein AB833_29650 [Chromatiales bacterium (ex Bugula neritina AB1)]
MGVTVPVWYPCDVILSSLPVVWQQLHHRWGSALQMARDVELELEFRSYRLCYGAEQGSMLANAMRYIIVRILTLLSHNFISPME